MGDGNWLYYIITVLLGGGLFKGLEAFYRAVVDSREKRILSDAVGAKTPVEVESLSVSTMASALESAQKRISSLEEERETDKKFYQDRINELLNQVQELRSEIEKTEEKLRTLVDSTKRI